MLGSVQRSCYLVNALFAIPKGSSIQTLIRTFPTSYGSEHTGQEFLVRGFLPVLELNLAIITA